MNELQYLLITDGSSDQALIPILNWLLRFYLPDTALIPSWLDPARLVGCPDRPADRLHYLIVEGVRLYSGVDVIFVHRDAENQSRTKRIEEIQEALDREYPHICVIPVRMMEAWLLFDEGAIRQAAGNPNGKTRLNLPALRTIEQLPDPKNRLYDLLKEASGLSGRRLNNFRPAERVHRLADLIDDFDPLRDLPAFQALEADIQDIIAEHGWGQPQDSHDSR